MYKWMYKWRYKWMYKGLHACKHIHTWEEPMEYEGCNAHFYPTMNNNEQQ